VCLCSVSLKFLRSETYLTTVREKNNDLIGEFLFVIARCFALFIPLLNGWDTIITIIPTIIPTYFSQQNANDSNKLSKLAGNT